MPAGGMPRDLPHIIPADDIREKLPAEMSKKLSSNKTAYHMGAISHGRFLYGPSPKLPTKIHGGPGDDTRKILRTLPDGVRRETDPEARNAPKAFTFGLLPPIAADTAFHPLVYRVSGRPLPENSPSDKDVRPAEARHRCTETWPAMHFLEKKGCRCGKSSETLKTGKSSPVFSAMPVERLMTWRQLTQFSSYIHGRKIHKTPDDLTQKDVKRGITLISAAEKYISDGNRKEFLHAVPNTNPDTGMPDTRA